MGAPSVDTCTRLDHLLAHLADALRRTAADQEIDAATPSHAPAPGTPVQGNLGALAAAVRLPMAPAR